MKSYSKVVLFRWLRIGFVVVIVFALLILLFKEVLFPEPPEAPIEHKVVQKEIQKEKKQKPRQKKTEPAKLSKKSAKKADRREDKDKGTKSDQKKAAVPQPIKITPVPMKPDAKAVEQTVNSAKQGVKPAEQDTEPLKQDAKPPKQVRIELEKIEGARQKRDRTAQEARERAEVRSKGHNKDPRQGITMRVVEALKDYREADEREKEAKNDEGSVAALKRVSEISEPEGIRNAIEKAIPNARKEVALREKETADFYREFVNYRKTMKKADKEGPEPKPVVKTELNGNQLLHHAKQAYSIQDTKKILKSRKDMLITLAWYDAQTRTLMEVFADFGNTFAFMAPYGRVRSSDRLFMVEGRPGLDAEVKEVPVSQFYSQYSLRYILMSDKPGSFRQRVEETLREKVIELCPDCESFEMRLFLSYEFYALVLSNAGSVANNNGLDLGKDVSHVTWMMKTSDSERWIQIVSVSTHDGRTIRAEN